MADPEKKPSSKEITPEKQTSLAGFFSEALDFVVKRDEAGSEKRAINLVLSASQLLRQEYQKYKKLGFGGEELSGFPINIMDKKTLIEHNIKGGLIGEEKEIPQEVFLAIDDSLDTLYLRVDDYPRGSYFMSCFLDSDREYLKFIGGRAEKEGRVELEIIKYKAFQFDNFSVYALIKNEKGDKNEGTNCMVSLPEETSIDPF